MEMQESFLNEEKFECDIEQKLNALGWDSIRDFERIDNRTVINFSLLKKKIMSINNVDKLMADRAINEIKKISDDLIDMNIKANDFILEGVKIYDDSDKLTKTISLISKDISSNTYQLIRQLEVSNGQTIRIPDVVLYINGLPIVVIELKAPLATEGIEAAWKQNESLKVHAPKLWMFNVMNFISNFITTKYGSITSSLKHFYGWQNFITKEGISPIEFLFNKERMLKIIFTYSFYTTEQNPTKYLAAPHQMVAVENTIAKLKDSKDTRGGVVWHTQGSGKSVTMVLLARAIVENFDHPTILMVTDRNALDQQLFQRFKYASKYLRNEAEMVESRTDLINKLQGKQHFGIYFTTVQKFAESTGVLSNRDDIFIMVDEAHRTQNNLDGEKILSKEKEELVVKFGFARFMRDAFPKAKITGFTGTPLMKFDKDTRDVFGEYNHVYSMNDAVKDGATVPILYEMRKVDIGLNQEYLREMDKVQQDYLKTLDGNDVTSQQKIGELFKAVRIATVLEDDDVIAAKSADILRHLEKRKQVLHGKAMIVANSRNAAFKYYKSLLEVNPLLKEEIILVMTESNKDDSKMKRAIVPKANIHDVAAEFRKSNSKYKIAIVVDMWLTGFDVPDLDVMYIDKIIKWHNLMQAIARVNRTFGDKDTHQIKESGLIVDYIGIWKFLADALIQYASGKDKGFDIEIEDVQKGKEKLNESFDIIENHYIKGIKSFDLLSSKDKYQFIMKSFGDILLMTLEQKNDFIKLARKTKRFFKIAYSIITDKESIIAKAIEIINSLVTSASIQHDEELSVTIESIKKAVAMAISTKTSEVEVHETIITKDINQVSSILAEEADSLIKTSPRAAIELLKSSLLAQIKHLERIRPVFARNVSDKLKDIIHELEKQEDLMKVIAMMRELGKEITAEAAKKQEFNEPQLQAFFEVISNDEYLAHNNNSEILRRIAMELMDTVKEYITDQFNTNKAVKEKMLYQLKKLLKTKYNYPPGQLGGTSGILIDLITREIKINESYFRKDD